MSIARLSVFGLVLPFLAFFGIFFTGCGEDSEAELAFLSDPKIEIMLGTADDPVASAPLYSSSLQSTKVAYNSNIISYDLNSGLITAKSAGSTTITATLQDKVTSVEVVVTEAVYCSSLNVSTSYFLKLTNSKPTEAIIPYTNAGYNMGFVFESLTPGVVSVDENGILTPESAGEAVVRVFARSACISGEYTYTVATTNVRVENVATEFNVEILDSGLNPVTATTETGGFVYYEINSREIANEYYVMRLTCDVPLKDKLQSFTASSVDSTDGQSAFDFSSELQNHTVITQDGKTLYRPFYATKAGFYYIQFNLDDSGLNYFNLISSNMLRVNIVGLCDEISLTSSIDDSSHVAYVDTKSIANFYVDVDMGEYNAQDFEYLVDSTVSSTRQGNRLYLSTSAIGAHTLTVRALDGSGVTATLNFEVKLSPAETGINLSSTEVSINVGEYAVIYFNSLPSFTEPCVVCVDEFGTEIEYDNSAILLDVLPGNLCITGLKSGSYFVKITTSIGLESQIISILVN